MANRLSKEKAGRFGAGEITKDNESREPCEYQKDETITAYTMEQIEQCLQ